MDNIVFVNNEYECTYLYYSREIPSISSFPSRVVVYGSVLNDTTVQLKLHDSGAYGNLAIVSAYPDRCRQAPEAIACNQHTLTAGDIWSIGYIMLEIFTAGVVFNVADDRELLAVMEKLCDAQIDSNQAPWVKDVTDGDPRSYVPFIHLLHDEPLLTRDQALRRPETSISFAFYSPGGNKIY